MARGARDVTYAAAKLVSGRRPIITATLQLDKCGNVYGQTVVNKLTAPEDFSDASYTKTATVTVNTDTAPDGTLTADTIEDLTTAYQYVLYDLSGALFNSASIYAASVFIKKDAIGAATRQPAFNLAFRSNTIENNVLILDTQTGEYLFTPASSVYSYGVQDKGDYWRLYIVAKSGDTANTTCRWQLYPAYASNWILAGSNTGGVVAWGAMLTEGYFVGYGGGTCTASAAAGGECYNTFNTCQDTVNYNASDTLDLTLTDANADILESVAVSNGGVFIPCIDTISVAPEKITPGKGLSYRGSVSINALDFAHHDINIDPYASSRSYAAMEQGTFFGKLIARNPNYVGRPVKITHYFEGQGRVATDVRELLYIIDAIDGPDHRGRVKITAKDPLILAEASKAQCPAASTGTLAANLASGTTTTFALNTGEGADYPTTAHILRINDELISITSRSGDTFTIAARGHGGTTPDDHTQDDTVQLCYIADGTASSRVDLVLADLLENYAAIPAAYIPTTEWDAEADEWANAYYLETIISEPTPVNTLISEICIETNSDIWWSPLDQEIKWQTQTPDFSSLSTLTDADFVNNAASIKSRQTERVSRVLYYSEVRNWVEPLDAKNYRALQVRIDTTGETANAYNAPAIKKIFARWMQNTSNTGEISSRYLSRFKNPPMLLAADLDLKDIDKAPGQHVNVISDITQGVDGAPVAVEMQILSAAHSPGSERVRIEALQYRYDSARYARVGPDTLNDYTLESEANQLSYGFICDTATLLMSNSDNPYVII